MSGIVGQNPGRGSGVVGATAVGADAVDSANIADDAIDSEHYTDGSIDNAHIADDAIDSEHYADGSIDNAHIADDAIDSEHYAAGSIDEAHIADNAVTLAKMAGGTDGNIISFDASGDPVAIATGNDGQVLTSAGAGAPPVFEDAAGGGKVLQVVHVKQSAEVTTTSTTAVDLTGMTIDTGSLATTSSKLLISVVVYASNSSSSRGAYFTVYSDTTLLDVGDHTGGLTTQSRVAMFTGTQGTSADSRCATAQFLYAPSSTDAQTVKVQWWVASNTGQLNRANTNENDIHRHRDVSSIVVQEIGA